MHSIDLEAGPKRRKLSVSSASLSPDDGKGTKRSSKAFVKVYFTFNLIFYTRMELLLFLAWHFKITMYHLFLLLLFMYIVLVIHLIIVNLRDRNIFTIPLVKNFIAKDIFLCDEGDLPLNFSFIFPHILMYIYIAYIVVLKDILKNTTKGPVCQSSRERQAR